MGAALAAAAVSLGHHVVIVSGPVAVQYPAEAELHWVVSTEEMAEAALRLFPECDGLIAVAAPCDFRPVHRAPQKLHRTPHRWLLELEETPDIVCRLSAIKRSQWMVAFALETEDARTRALEKLQRKQCDLIVVNNPSAMEAPETSVEVLDREGRVLGSFAGSKQVVGGQLMDLFERQLIHRFAPTP